MESGRAEPERLAALTARVVRGVGRLLCDPGLDAHNRIRLEADLRFLTEIDPSDRASAVEHLAAYLPRVLEAVEAVTPLYLRLHRDIASLLALVTELGANSDLAAPPRSPQSPFEPRPIAQAPPGQPLVHVPPPPEVDPTSLVRWLPLRIRLLVALVGVILPATVLTAHTISEGQTIAVIVSVGLLGLAAGAAGVVVRALFVPDSLPRWATTRLAPQPLQLTARLRRAAVAGWHSRRHDTLEVG